MTDEQKAAMHAVVVKNGGYRIGILDEMFSAALLASSSTASVSAEEKPTVKDRARRFVTEFSRDVGFAMSDAQQEIMLNLFIKHATPAQSIADTAKFDETRMFSDDYRAGYKEALTLSFGDTAKIAALERDIAENDALIDDLRAQLERAQSIADTAGAKAVAWVYREAGKWDVKLGDKPETADKAHPLVFATSKPSAELAAMQERFNLVAAINASYVDEIRALRESIADTAGALPDCPICGDNDKVSSVSGKLTCGRCSASPAIDAAPDSHEPEAVASVYQNKNGETYVQFDVENAEDIQVGAKLYLRPFEMTRQQIQEIAGYVEDEGKACSISSLYIAAESAVEETLRRLSIPVPIESPDPAIDAAGASEEDVWDAKRWRYCWEHGVNLDRYNIEQIDAAIAKESGDE